jgi:hypothetical protein
LLRLSRWEVGLWTSFDSGCSCVLAVGDCLSAKVQIPFVRTSSPSGILLLVRADLKAAKACDRLPSRLRTELDEEAADIMKVSFHACFRIL